jgi:hypothetical protein
MREYVEVLVEKAENKPQYPAGRMLTGLLEVVPSKRRGRRFCYSSHHLIISMLDGEYKCSYMDAKEGEEHLY